MVVYIVILELLLLASTPNRVEGQVEAAWNGAAEFSHSIFTGTCQKVREEEARSAIERQRNCSVSGSNKNSHDLTELTKFVVFNPNDRAEDYYFSSLADRQADELDCAASFAAKVAAGAPEAIKTLGERLKSLRAARMDYLQTIKDLHLADASSIRGCPTTLSELDTSAYGNSRVNAVCTRQIKARTAYEMIRNSLPLVGEKNVEVLAKNYSARPTDLSDDALAREIASVYSNSASVLKNQSARLKSRVSHEGGQGFTNDEKHTLLEDPFLTEEIVAKNPTLFGPVACKADAVFGSGATARDTALTVGSLVLGGAALISTKGGAIAANMARSAVVARAAGTMSLTSARALQAGAMLATSATATAEIQKLCAHRRWSHKASSAKKDCASAPKIEDMDSDSCLLTAALTTMDLASYVSPTHLLATVPIIVSKVTKEDRALAKGLFNELRLRPQEMRLSDDKLNSLHDRLEDCISNKKNCGGLIAEIKEHHADSALYEASISRLQEDLDLKLKEPHADVAEIEKRYFELDACKSKVTPECLELFNKVNSEVRGTAVGRAPWSPPSVADPSYLMAGRLNFATETAAVHKALVAARSTKQAKIAALKENGKDSLYLTNPQALIELAIGKGPRQIVQSSYKVNIQTAGNMNKIVLDSNYPYFTIQDRAGNYLQFVRDAKTGQMREAVGHELVPRADPPSKQWAEQTHFAY